MSRKRIAVITARADDSEQKNVLFGIAEAAFAADADVVVYSNIYNHWAEDEQLNFENIIYTLFEPRYFDGAIITAEAFRDIALLDGVAEKLRKAKLPTVVIGGELDGFDSVFSDDETDMERIAEHLITVHGYTDIDILTGFVHDAVALRRADGCIRAFEKHGIPFSERKLHYGNFWNDSGEELAQRYISGELPLPQAVICTNDHMAYGICDALSAAGISIPDRIAVTGYDYTGGRVYHYPLLTTYYRNRWKLGRDAANKLLCVSYAADDSDRFISGSTCSCGVRKEQLISELTAERIGQYHTIMSSVAQFSSRLTACRTLAEYTAVLGEFFYLLHGADTLYLCLDSAWNSESYEGEEFFCCRIEEGQSSAPIRYAKEDIPVPFLGGQEHSLYYVSPVCFQTRLFGYSVLRYGCPACYDFSFRDWSKTAADMLEFLRMKNDIHYLAQCQRASSMYDSLTGFYNPREFRQIIEATENIGSIMAVKLGFTEDGEFIYGENYRNDIISATATAIKQACSNHEICCRAYDDIFIIHSKETEHILSDKLEVTLYDSLCGQYDERQVLISFAAQNADSIEQLCTAVTEKGIQDMEALSERRKLQHYNALQDIRSRILRSPGKTPALSLAAKQMCVSEGHFRSIYRQCYGVSYNQDCINAKLLKARHLLSYTAMSIYAIALSCGYSDEKYFARQFRQNIGCSPMEYRKRSC